MSIPSLLVATTNLGKLAEFRILFEAVEVRLEALSAAARPPQVVEDGDSYLANAARKAKAIARWSQRPTLADDSGLEVDILHGQPGIHSARYAGVEQDEGANLAKLLSALGDAPVAQRTARFRCAIVVARPDGASVSAEGTCEGLVLSAPQGTGGFGYDPVFYYPPLRRTFAQLSITEKNQVSHRARACAELTPHLLSFLRRSDPPA